MALIELELPWTSQPQEVAGVNPAFDSRSLMLPSLMYDIPRRRPISRGQNTRIDASPFGVAVTGTSTTGYCRVSTGGAMAEYVDENLPIAIGVRFKLNNAAASGQALFGDMGNSGYQGHSINYSTSAGGLLAFNVRVNGTSAYSVSTAFSDTDNWHDALLIHVNGDGIYGYLDGQQVGYAATPSGPRYIDGGGPAWLAMGTYNSSTGFQNSSASIVIGYILQGDYLNQAESLSANPWQLFAPQSIWVPVSAGGGGATPAGTATEADTSLALTARQIAATGTSTETDAAQALVAVQIAVTGRADETETALALTPVQITVAGLASETDAALALDPGATGAVGVALETDVAMALAAVQISTVGAASEADSALALDAVVGTAPGIAQETDTALALAAVQIAAVGISEETDAALAPGSADLAEVVSLGGARPKPRMRRQRIQDYDVPLPPEVLTSTIPHDTPPAGIEPVSALSKLKPASKLATRPAREKVPKIEAPAPLPAVAPQPQPAPAAAPASTPMVTAAAPAPAIAVAAARPMMLSDILAAESMTNDEILRAMKVLARLHIGPQVKRDSPKVKVIRG